MRYHVTYFYLATGMEGRADKEDYGIIEATSPEDAKKKAARRRHPHESPQDIDWCVGCLTAKEVK